MEKLGQNAQTGVMNCIVTRGRVPRECGNVQRNFSVYYLALFAIEILTLMLEIVLIRQTKIQ